MGHATFATVDQRPDESRQTLVICKLPCVAGLATNFEGALRFVDRKA